MSVDDRYCVYYWINETTNEPFYVGKGRRERALRKAGGSRNRYFNEVFLNNKCHVEFYKENIPEDEACQLERKLIAEFREKGYPLTNITDGGEKGPKIKFTEEQIRMFSEQTRGSNNPNYGHKWTDEMKQKTSERMIETQCHKGAKNGRAVKVMCVETGEIFGCKSDAADFLGVANATSSIIFCLRNPLRVAGKKKYHFVGEDKFAELDTEQKRHDYLDHILHLTRLRKEYFKELKKSKQLEASLAM